MSIKFVERFTIQRSRFVDGSTTEQVDGSLLVAEEDICRWTEDEGQSGCARCSIFPSYYKGERAWLVNRWWDAGIGYNAWGTDQEILTFQKGVELLLKLGAYQHLFPKK